MKRVVALGLALALAGAGCHRGKGDIAGFRDALATGDTAGIARATAGAPTCGAEAGARAPEACLGEIATWFGSKTGFQYAPPDQAGAATAALLIVREGRGEWAPSPDAWLFTVRAGKGEGADALRLAVASRMASAIPPLAHALATDDEARALMGAVAGSVPGACDTYARLGAGEDALAGAPERTADHSPCVQKDLERSTGPREHGRYGNGLWRGAEGALALWRGAAAALREGLGLAEGSVQAGLGARLGVMEEALGKVAPKKLPPAPDYSMYASDTHGGAGGAADGGARRAERPGK